jgi:integrase
MSKRRGNDEGSIYESPEGSGNWFAQLPPDSSGKRPKRRANSQKSALAKLREMQHKRKEGVNPGAKRMRLNDLLDLWLEQSIRRNVKDRTLEGYEDVLRLHVRPKFGNEWVDEINTLMILSWMNELRDTYSANVTRNAFARLKAALDAAVEWGKITRNPANAKSIKLPKATQGKECPMTLAHMQHWLEATQSHRLGTLYLMAAILGLRLGELCGLAWRHYDRQSGTLRIERQIGPVRGISEEGDIKGKVPFTLPVPPLLAETLDRHWELLQRERTSEGWHEHGLIFPSENGTPLIHSNVNRHLRDNLKRLNLPHWSMHDFRRFTATRLGEPEVSEHIIGGILAHKPGRNVTRRYAQATVESMRLAILKLEQDIFARAA